MKQNTQILKHETVLLDETVKGLSLFCRRHRYRRDSRPRRPCGEDCENHREECYSSVIDVDDRSITRSRERLDGASAKVIFMRGNFRNLKALAEEAGVKRADGIVFDLGWHAEQLAEGKGLSFKSDEPLVITLGERSATLTAKDIIADWDEEEIARIIRAYGEERFAGRIARAIVEARREKPIETARELSEIIFHAVPGFYPEWPHPPIHAHVPGAPHRRQ